jgi:hypothetical protein
MIGTASVLRCASTENQSKKLSPTGWKPSGPRCADVVPKTRNHGETYWPNLYGVRLICGALRPGRDSGRARIGAAQRQIGMLALASPGGRCGNCGPTQFFDRCACNILARRRLSVTLGRIRRHGTGKFRTGEGNSQRFHCRHTTSEFRCL